MMKLNKNIVRVLAISLVLCTVVGVTINENLFKSKACDLPWGKVAIEEQVEDSESDYDGYAQLGDNEALVGSAYENVDEDVSVIAQKYIKFVNNQFVVDTNGMIESGLDANYVDTVKADYASINIELQNCTVDEEIRQGAANCVTRSKLSTAVNVIKKYLVKSWPKIVAKMPKIAKTFLKAELIVSLLDTYIGVSDTITELLTQVINAILPPQLHILTPGIVTIIMFVLPI